LRSNQQAEIFTPQSQSRSASAENRLDDANAVRNAGSASGSGPGKFGLSAVLMETVFVPGSES
jgi:hypothetical protein